MPEHGGGGIDWNIEEEEILAVRKHCRVYGLVCGAPRDYGVGDWNA